MIMVFQTVVKSLQEKGIGNTGILWVFSGMPVQLLAPTILYKFCGLLYRISTNALIPNIYVGRIWLPLAKKLTRKK
jgi:hypothetical protein